MKKSITLYHRKASGKIKVWQCKVVGTAVISEWGQQDGKKSRTVENTKASSFASAEQRALALFEKKVLRRKHKGYVERLDDVVKEVSVQDTELDFDKPLPRSFSPGKPIKKVEPNEMARWARKDLIFIQRKRDGMRHTLVSDSKSRLRIYSSGKDDMTEHLWPLIEDIQLPPQTILDVELVVTEPGKEERDGFLIVSGIARSLPDRARRQIALAQGMGARVQLFAFDLLWLEGEPLYREIYSVRYKTLARIVDNADQATDDRTLVRMPLVSISSTRLATLTEAIDMVKKFKWEGLVLWRKDQATVVQVNGSPKRCNCWKLKPVGEEDVIATSFEYGKGKNHNVVGKFNLAMIRKGKPVPMGRCGTGLDDATRAAALKWTYPCVIQIEYDQKSEKGFRFPVFIRKRDDKKVADCKW